MTIGYHQAKTTSIDLAIEYITVCLQLSLILLDDEVVTSAQSSEFLRLVLEGVVVEISHSTLSQNKKTTEDSMDVAFNILNAILYNQHIHQKQYDFPIVLTAQKPLTFLSSDTFTIKVMCVQ